jgi:hypothetical protein
MFKQFTVSCLRLVTQYNLVIVNNIYVYSVTQKTSNSNNHLRLNSKTLNITCQNLFVRHDLQMIGIQQ